MEQASCLRRRCRTPRPCPTHARAQDKAVALVLGFIGVKMLVGFAHVEVPTDLSLLVVFVLLGGGIGASLFMPAPAEEAEK